MSTWKICYECNNIQELEADIKVVCYQCRLEGQSYYLMSISELLISAREDSKSGFELKAIKKREMAMRLQIVSVIQECINVASREYREAQREGLDCHAAHECLMDGLANLLKASILAPVARRREAA